MNVSKNYKYNMFAGPCRRAIAIGEMPGRRRVGGLRRAWPFFDIWILSRTVPACPGEACPASPGNLEILKISFFGHLWSRLVTFGHLHQPLASA